MCQSVLRLKSTRNTRMDVVAPAERADAIEMNDFCNKKRIYNFSGFIHLMDFLQRPLF